MKNIVVLSLLIISLSIFFFAQQANAQGEDFKCGTMEYLRKQLEEDPGLKNVMLMQESQIRESIKALKESDNDEVINIPIVFHILFHTDEENISDLKVYEQLEITNRDYAGLNPHSMGGFPDSLKANTKVQFCLAQRKPDGSPTNGIERRQTDVISFIGDNKVKFYNSGGLDAWNPKKYMNIWICNMDIKDTSGYVFSGYAQFPNAGINATFGVVIRYGTIGVNDTMNSRGNGGVLTHEIAHCFYLYHIWGDDGYACTGSDYCDDTPNQAGKSLGIHTGIMVDSCSPDPPGIMYMNIMDYSDDICFANFTPDQAARMRAMFVPPYGPLVPLLSSDGCIPPVNSIDDDAKSSVFVFPNPAKDVININYPLKSSAVVNISIFNSFGKEIISLSSNKVYEIGSQSLSIDVGGLSQGVYYLSIKAGNYIETRKFVVVK